MSWSFAALDASDVLFEDENDKVLNGAGTLSRGSGTKVVTAL